MATSIRILNGSTLPSSAIQAVSSGLHQQFGVPVEVAQYWFDLDKAVDKARGQYLSVALLRQMLHDEFPPGDVKLIGIADVDLFAPVLTFVFGEAQLGGPCGVLSTFRLQNEFYGIPPDDAMFVERVVIEAIHETGHLFGLIHCPAFDCAMRSSTYVEEIDLKTRNLCPRCKDELVRVEIFNNAALSGLRKPERGSR